MKLYIARHGRSNYNDLNLCNADPNVDVHLTDLGREQALTLADKLKDIKLDRIYVSELRRTQQTADIVNESRHIDVEVAPLLNEHRSGYEGQSGLDFFNAWQAAEDKWTVRLNDGESIEDVKVRVRQFLDKLKTKSYDAVLIITSEWVVRSLISILQNVSNEDAWDATVIQGDYLEFEV